MREYLDLEHGLIAPLCIDHRSTTRGNTGTLHGTLAELRPRALPGQKWYRVRHPSEKKKENGLARAMGGQAEVDLSARADV